VGNVRQASSDLLSPAFALFGKRSGRPVRASDVDGVSDSEVDMSDSPGKAASEPVPAFSVALPCYKVSRYVGEALESVRAQTFRDFETIVVNDGCPDTENLEQALAPYRAEIIYIRQQNQGVAAARNAAVLAARAPFVAMLDPDDAWTSDYLETLAALLQEHPDVDVVYPNPVIFGDSPWAGRTLGDFFPLSAEVTFNNLISEECFVLGAAAIRREAALRVGLYDPEFHIGEDRDLWLRMAKSGSKFRMNPSPVYRYRLRATSLTADSVSTLRASAAVYSKLLKTWALTEEERRVAEAAIRKCHGAIDLVLGKDALYEGRYAAALEKLRCARHTFTGNRKLRIAIFLLRIWPQLLSALVHWRYPDKTSYVR
jgi:glycosyltransferase involved in cell wall biosynthesis